MSDRQVGSMDQGCGGLDELGDACREVYRLVGRYAAHDAELQVDRVLYGFLVGRYRHASRQFPVSVDGRPGRIDFFVNTLGPCAIELAVRRLDEGESRLLAPANRPELEKLNAVDPVAARRVLVLMDFGRRQIPMDVLRESYAAVTPETRAPEAPVYVMLVRRDKIRTFGWPSGTKDIQPDGDRAMARQFATAGLARPPVPVDLRADVRYVDRWLFATDLRVDRRDLYEPLPAVTRLLEADEWTDRFVVGSAGHGVNSHVIGYHLVYRRIALFAERLYGGIYMDAERSTSAVNSLFHSCEHVIRIAGENRGGDRLVALDSDILPNVAGWVGNNERVDARRWLKEHETRLPALDAAIALLSGPTP